MCFVFECFICLYFGQIFLNNSFALDSTWIYPEESGLFHSHEKPHFLASQVTPSLSRPAPASRPLPTVVLAAQPIPGQSPANSDKVPVCVSHKSAWKQCHFHDIILLANSFRTYCTVWIFLKIWVHLLSSFTYRVNFEDEEIMEGFGQGNIGQALFS